MLQEKPSWVPADGWDGDARMEALREAEAHGDCHREGDKVVYHSLDALFRHFADVVERRPELMKSVPRNPDSEADDEAAAAEVDDAIKSGKGLNVSNKLKGFLQRYQVRSEWMCMWGDVHVGGTGWGRV